MQLFSRIISVAKSDEDFALCLDIELTPRPLSLFDEIFTLKTDKAVMYHSADVCRAAAILRPTCLLWIEDIYYISKCVDMASACDIPRLVEGVVCTKTLLRWLLDDIRWIQRWP